MNDEELKALLRAEDNKLLSTDSTPFEDLINMSDEQAADILDDMFFKPQLIGGRRNGKTYLMASQIVAVVKAINRLRGNQ